MIQHLQNNTNVCFIPTLITNALKNGNLEASHLVLRIPDLTIKRTLIEWFYLEMVSCRVINKNIQTPLNKILLFLKYF